MSRTTVVFLTMLGVAAYAAATPSFIDLASASNFGVLGGSTVTNTGITGIHGDLGVWPGLSITGAPTVTNGVIHAGDAVAMQAQSDLTAAFNTAAAQACGTDLTGQDLGSLTLTSGIYCFSSSAQLTGTLTLNAQGNANAFFLFQIVSTLTTASSSAVAFSNGAGGLGSNIYWQIGSSATLGTNTAFAGNILALASITLTNGATISCGRALASGGAVTMDSNQVSIGTAGCEANPSAVPEPGTAGLLGLSLLLCLALGVRSNVAAGLLMP